jgi:hypothetical protein
MKLFKLMASVCAVSAAFMFAACDDSSSANSNDDSSASYDCSVEDGVKVVSPKKGDSFKMGDTITVIYGSDVQGSGYRFVFKTSEEDGGLDMLEESAGPMKPDGKKCYEQKVVLTDDVAEPTKTAIIRVVPYEQTAKGANSGTFKVTE